MPLATSGNLSARCVVFFSWKLVNGRECSIMLFYYLAGICIVWIPEVGRKMILPVAKFSSYRIIPSVHSGTRDVTKGDNH